MADATSDRRVSAFDCLHRGLANLRANWELIVVRWLGFVAIALLVLAGLVLPFVVLGLGILGGGLRNLLAGGAQAWESFGDRLGQVLPQAGLALALALVGTLLLWLFAGVLYCYLQAGIFGVLTAAERQALPGGGRGREWFRTFSLHNLFGWGGRYMGRFFGFVNLYALAWSGVLLAFVLWVFLLVGGGQRWGRPAAWGIGCGGALPLLFLVVVVELWGTVAMADLARETSGAWTAAANGLRILGKRFGAVFFLCLFFVACELILVAAGLFAGFVVITLALAKAPFGLAFGVRATLQVVQSLAGSALALALSAALVALVQSEVARKPQGGGAA